MSVHNSNRPLRFIYQLHQLYLSKLLITLIKVEISPHNSMRFLNASSCHIEEDCTGDATNKNNLISYNIKQFYKKKKK